MDVARKFVVKLKGLQNEIGGINALCAAAERLRFTELNEQQLATVRAALLRSPTEHGFGAGL